MARQVRGDSPEEPTPIPAPGGPETQNVVNQPQENYPQPGTGPKQPGYNLAHDQMVGEANEEFEDRALDAEEEHRASTEQQREEKAKKDEEQAQASQQQMEQRDQEREQRRQQRRQEREQKQQERQEARQEAPSEG